MKFRLPIVGEVAFNEPPTTLEVIKEVKAKEKNLFAAGFADFLLGTASNTISSKLLMANSGWVYRNNDVIAKEVATIEFELFTTRVVGQEIQYNPVLSHPLLDALDRFNGFTDASSGFYMTQSHRKLTGNAYWYIDGAGTNVQGIYILMPDKIKIVSGKVASGQVDVERYEYRNTIDGKRVDETYLPDEIIHFKMPDPSNYLKGKGAVEAAADDIDLDNLAIEANKQMFKRGLIANFALSTENSLTQEQLKQIRTEFKSAYGGVDNAYKVPILSGGLKPENLQMTNKDAEFMALQEWTRDKITSIFGNNKAVLGVTDDVNRANAESTILNWKRTTIRSEMKAITDTLNEFFVPRYGKNLVLGFKDPVGEDEQGEIVDVSNMIGAGIITPNEAREILGYDPLPDEAANQLPSKAPAAPQAPEQVPKSLRYVNRDKLFRKTGTYDKIELYKSAKAAARTIAKKHLQAKKKALPIKPESITAYYAKQMKLVDLHEHIFNQRIEKFINQLVEKAIKEIPHEIQKSQSKQLFNEQDEIDQAILDFTPILMDIVNASGAEAMNLINSDQIYTTTLRSTIEQRVKLFATSMVQTDQQKLVDIIANGVKENLSIPQIKNQIIDSFDTWTPSQAQMITRTEVISALNQASLDAWDQSGMVEGKQWLASPDVSDYCADYDGQIVYDLGGSFYDSDSEFADGDPPIHPNCRCVVVPVFESSKSLDKHQLRELQLQKLIKSLREEVRTGDKRTKKYKEQVAELKKYNKELEDYLEEA